MIKKYGFCSTGSGAAFGMHWPTGMNRWIHDLPPHRRTFKTPPFGPPGYTCGDKLYWYTTAWQLPARFNAAVKFTYQAGIRS